MARDYQRQTGKYILPREVYNQTIWLIRDYNRLKAEAEAILDESPAPADGMPKNPGVSDPVVAKALKRERIKVKVDAIETEIERVPTEYRSGVWNNIIYRRPFPNDASRSTYGMWKSRFVCGVAVKMDYI